MASFFHHVFDENESILFVYPMRRVVMTSLLPATASSENRPLAHESKTNFYVNKKTGDQK